MRIATALALLLLAGCGSRQQLAPREGVSLPVAPYGATATPTPDQLLTPPPITRPEPSGELLKRSEPREGDRFDLPPN